MQAAPPPVHWTTYVQTFAVIASTIGTFLYVYFTYHIMKWAVSQGKAEIELSRLEVEDVKRKQFVIDSELETALVQQYLELLSVICMMRDGSEGPLPFPLAESRIAKLEGEWSQALKREISTRARTCIAQRSESVQIALSMCRSSVDDPATVELRRTCLLRVSMELATTVHDLLLSEYGRNVDRGLITKMAGLP